MKDSSNTAKKLLDLPYAPEAEQYLDELERSGQFRIGLEAEIDDAEAVDAPPATTTPGVAVRAACRSRTGGLPVASRCASARALRPADVTLARINDSLVLRTQDGLDRLMLEGYLGPDPGCSTLRIIFSDGSEWSGAELVSRIAQLAGRSRSRRQPAPR